MTPIRIALAAFALAAAVLAATVLPLTANAAGPTEPQTTEGPCQVKQFFIVTFGTSNTDMTITAGAQPCTFTVINPDLQAFQTAALVTTPPAHGHAEAGLVNGGTSAAIRYTPAPDYTGPDRFTTTIEPSDKAVIVSVTVSAP